MDKLNYTALRETIHHCVLPNGLNIYVDTRPEYGKQFAFFATRYGGMDLRFRGEDGEWVDTPQGVAQRPSAHGRSGGGPQRLHHAVHDGLFLRRCPGV